MLKHGRVGFIKFIADVWNYPCSFIAQRCWVIICNHLQIIAALDAQILDVVVNKLSY